MSNINPLRQNLIILAIKKHPLQREGTKMHQYWNIWKNHLLPLCIHCILRTNYIITCTCTYLMLCCTSHFSVTLLSFHRFSINNMSCFHYILSLAQLGKTPGMPYLKSAAVEQCHTPGQPGQGTSHNIRRRTKHAGKRETWQTTGPVSWFYALLSFSAPLSAPHSQVSSATYGTSVRCGSMLSSALIYHDWAARNIT